MPGRSNLPFSSPAQYATIPDTITDTVSGPYTSRQGRVFMSVKAAECTLTLEIERAHGKAIVRCKGRLVSGVEDVLYTEVRQLFPDSKRVTLDLTDLTHMDSMGLGALVRLYVSARSAGCELVLLNLGRQVRQLLGMTNLLSVFVVIGEHGIRLG
jgi:anti-sigma B factor antagonist